MFHNSAGELVTKIIKDNDGISFEFNYYIQLNSNEIEKLKGFRENYAKSSTIHFNFEEGGFSFNQKKYYKKKQFITDPPELDDIESNFLDNIKRTLNQFKNFLHFDKLENGEKTTKINITEILQRI